MATKKKVIKQLKRAVDNFPTVLAPMIFMPEKVMGHELIMQGQYDDGSANPVVPEKEYIQQMPVQIAHNHMNRLKKQYKKSGNEGVLKYITHLRETVNAHHEQHK